MLFLRIHMTASHVPMSVRAQGMENTENYAEPRSSTCVVVNRIRSSMHRIRSYCWCRIRSWRTWNRRPRDLSPASEIWPPTQSTAMPRRTTERSYVDIDDAQCGG